MFRKNLGNLGELFGQMVYRPSWQKISRTPMNIEIFSSNYNGSLVSFSKEIVTFALTGVKYGRRRKTIVLYVKKSLNKHGSHSFMLIKYFYLFFNVMSARLKHNLRLLFQ